MQESRKLGNLACLGYELKSIYSLILFLRTAYDIFFTVCLNRPLLSIITIFML